MTIRMGCGFAAWPARLAVAFGGPARSLRLIRFAHFAYVRFAYGLRAITNTLWPSALAAKSSSCSMRFLADCTRSEAGTQADYEWPQWFCESIECSVRLS